MEAKFEGMSLTLPSSELAQDIDGTSEPCEAHKSKSAWKSKLKSKPTEVVESWEEDFVSSSDSEAEASQPTSTFLDGHHAHHGRSAVNGAKISIPNAPPPTPISPEAGFKEWPTTSNTSKYPSISSPTLSHPNSPRQSRPLTADSERRPEKTTAAANRMIAGALGVRAPKKTEEQRAYDRAVREQEIKRKEREKEAKTRELEEDEKAKASVWDE